MLVAEYDYDIDIAVQRLEERRIAFADGSYQKALETARFMKRVNCDTPFIVQATGLSEEEIEQL